MTKKIARIFILAAFVAVGYLLGLVGAATTSVALPRAKVLRSPARAPGPALGTLKIPDDNHFFRRVLKAMRSAPPFLWCCGWKVWSEDECATGIIGTPRVSDDGDIVFDLSPDEESRDIIRLMDSAVRKETSTKILGYVHCEIPYEYRGDFTILEDLQEGLPMRVCGRFVWDRAWGHNELHPVRWMEIR